MTPFPDRPTLGTWGEKSGLSVRMEVKCWLVRGWEGGQAALTDLRSLPAGGKLRAFRGCELWVRAAPIPYYPLPSRLVQREAKSFLLQPLLSTAWGSRQVLGWS